MPLVYTDKVKQTALRGESEGQAVSNRPQNSRPQGRNKNNPQGGPGRRSEAQPQGDQRRKRRPNDDTARPQAHKHVDKPRPHNDEAPLGKRQSRPQGNASQSSDRHGSGSRNNEAPLGKRRQDSGQVGPKSGGTPKPSEQPGRNPGQAKRAPKPAGAPKPAKQPKQPASPALPDRRKFLPTTPQDLKDRGIEQLDFVYVSGDAYVDHSSFGTAIISRVLVAFGYTVGIIAQPDWRDPESIAILGEPRLGFLVSSGNMDSMVNHYTSNKKRRSTDAYSPGGEAGLRPNRAVSVYGNLIRKRFKHTPIIIGGIEASLRRLAHYDYWSDSLKRSILLDSNADLLIYGMGEHAIHEVADSLAAGIAVQDITYVAGTVYRARDLEATVDPVMLPSYQEMLDDKTVYAKSFYTQYCNMDSHYAKTLVEQYEEHLFVVQNPPAEPLSADELDFVYELPYAGTYHPDYEAAGGVPAIKEIKFSLTSNRGCFGGCSFCALAFHQGRRLQARSHESLVREAKALTALPDFKGYIHDVGGPTANFQAPACTQQLKRGVCPTKQCLFPKPCRNLKPDHTAYIKLLRELRELPGVKKVFVRSGIRFDYIMADPHGEDFIRELSAHHVSGQLRVAPEHVSDNVLALMGKPGQDVYQAFCDEFKRINKQLGLEQYVVPYLISSHPGSTMDDAIALAEAVRDMGYMPEQVSDFYPTPSTLSTVMYYTGLDPRTMQPIYVPRDPQEKAMQRALIQYRDPKNYDLVHKALVKAGRQDLIGYDKHCLIRPTRPKQAGNDGGAAGKGKRR